MVISSVVIGYIGSTAAIIGFGSNYIPVKRYPVGNGLAYAFILSIGGIVVAFISMIIADSFVFTTKGILGGSLWGTANLLIIPIIKLIGLGLGVLLWSSIGIIVGFLIGKFGWFGIDKNNSIVVYDWMNWLGFVCVVVSIFCFFFIKPTLEEKEPLCQTNNKRVKHISISINGDQYQREDEEYDGYKEIENTFLIDQKKQAKVVVDEESTIFDKIPDRLKTVTGILMSVICGILLGVNMIPMQIWKQNHPESSPFDLIFSQFAGVFLFNSFIFMFYALALLLKEKKSPQIYAETILPSFISGIVWGIANCGLIVSTTSLGYTIGYPISCAGPMLISSMWSALYLGEIKGRKNFLILTGSLILLVGGIILIALSSFQ